LLKNFCEPQKNTHCTFMLIYGHILIQDDQKFEFEQNDTLLSRFSTNALIKCFKYCLFDAVFLFSFSFVVLLFEATLKYGDKVLECCLLFLSTKSLWCALQRKYMC
jgi:hypothetical protein